MNLSLPKPVRLRCHLWNPNDAAAEGKIDFECVCVANPGYPKKLEGAIVEHKIIDIPPESLQFASKPPG